MKKPLRPSPLAAATLTLVLALSGLAPAQLCGDANGDSTVSILDALATSRHDVGLTLLTGDALRLGDVDGDRRVSVLDALLIAQKSAGLPILFGCPLPPFPAPIETTEGRFATSQVCAQCHSNIPTATAMRDELGQPVAPFDLWLATMMANSARDPLWRAQVSAEKVHTPSKAREIEQKCVSCHAPMASTEAFMNGEPRPGLEIIGVDTPRGHLALDGVSCTLCHQIKPDGLGTPASYSAGFVIDDLERVIYGPHTSPLEFAMESLSGFKPVEGQHTIESNLCGSCHTLYTDTLDPGGTETGEIMPEQMPYLEWRNSVFNDETPMPGPEAASCQDCHVPTDSEQGVPIDTILARTPAGTDYGIASRMPYGRHLFVGGNTLLPQILRDNAVELGVLAPSAAFDTVIDMTLAQLQNDTATLQVGSVTRASDTLMIPVTVTNHCGHKLPSGYPARRAWIRLEVRDAMGSTVFVSGDYNTAGGLLDGSGQPHAIDQVGGPIEPHHEAITNPDQVQVYETIMRDTAGQPTWLLMRAAGYAKDNRLLPRGWSTSHPDINDIAPAGTGPDMDYTGAAGEDNLVYMVTAPASAGPYTIEASLHYQTLSVRTANQLFQTRTSEIQAFRYYYQRADRTPVTVSSDMTTAP